MQKEQKISILRLIAIGLWVAATFGVSSCLDLRRGEVREFPEDFQGWGIVVWGVPRQPALPIKGGKFLERFPADGILITSTKQEFGWGSEENFYVDHDGKRTPSRPVVSFGGTGTAQQNNQAIKYSSVFVGPEDELSKGTNSAAIDRVFEKLRLGRS